MDFDKVADESKIEVGDRVSVVSPDGKAYKTMVEDIHEKGPLLLGVPSIKGMYMPVSEGDDIYLVYYRKTGRFIAQMKVIALEKQGVIRYMWLLQKAVAQKNQRRNAYRLPIMFDVKISEYVEDSEKDIVNGVIVGEPDAIEYETASSRDLSISGVALTTKKIYIVGQKYSLRMYFDRTPASVRVKSSSEGSPPLEVAATVRRCIPWKETKFYDTGLQFDGLSKHISESISRFVLTEQQKQMRKRRML